ncbi:outer membrane protein assembly factor BamB family protein [Methanoregula formicica]|uniref:WD40 repeat-containing protein n=1 Tax=Methanoregula formicica (strain DSM 22288 / NBRC 105244 / SMSP) TaxID=593750 RepID=L0HKF6_METFS|nr:WD40 repeat domain-containing protein [Methanoregula formicica]AGB03549.1 WD40 repeat-containing protein [Methanoregula formicica SMSP]
MRSAATLPVFGPLLLRREIRRLSRNLRNGDLSAIGKLAEIETTSKDKGARQVARESLASLMSQEAIDALCNEALLREDPFLRDLALEKGYTPNPPGAKALFLFLSGQDETFLRFDPEDHHPRLAEGYANAQARIRLHALRYATENAGTSRGHVLAHALLGREQDSAAKDWSYGEWALVMKTLACDASWDLLWRLVRMAPPAFSRAALETMNSAGWHLEGDERQVFEELIADLPESWNSPLPEKPLSSNGVQDSQVLRLSFSRDGTLLGAGSCDGTIATWNVASARLLGSCTPGTGSPHFLAFTLDNTLLIAGGDRGTLHATTLSGEPVWVFDDPSHPVGCAILSSSGEEILAGDREGYLFSMGCKTGAVRFSAPCHPSPVTALAQIAGGQSLATGHADGTVCCFDALTGVMLWTVTGTGDPVRALAFSEESGGILVIRGHALPVCLSGQNGSLVRAFARHSGTVSCSAISRGCRTVVVGTNTNVLRIWHEGDNPTVEIPLYNRVPSCCAITQDGTCLIAGCNEGTVFSFHLPEGVKTREIRAYRRPVSACSLSPEGRLLALAGWDGTVALRSVPDGELLRTLRRSAGAVTSLAFAGRETGILAGTADGTVRLFSPGSDTAGRCIDLYTPSLRTIAASPDGAVLACAGKEPGLRFWDIRTGGLLSSCSGLKTSVRCLAFLPDEKTLITGGWDGRVRFWDVPSGTAKEVCKGHTSTVTCCAVSPSGELFVTGSNDTTVRIWQSCDTKEPLVLRDAGKEVSCCAISPEGTLLAAAGADPVIRLYHLPDGARAYDIHQVPGIPTVLSFASNGLSLAVGYADGTLAFYSLHDRGLIRTLPAHAGAVTGIISIAEKDSVVTSGEDGRVCTFRVPFIQPLSFATFADLELAREHAGGTEAMATQWRFLYRLLSLRFQDEIELCPVFLDAGALDIQIVG